MKGLEALQRLYAKLSCKSDIKDIEENLKQYDIIEKELKALEILKEKLSPLAKVTFLPMTQEEYELVTEVLLCH